MQPSDTYPIPLTLQYMLNATKELFPSRRCHLDKFLYPFFTRFYLLLLDLQMVKKLFWKSWHKMKILTSGTYFVKWDKQEHMENLRD